MTRYHLYNRTSWRMAHIASEDGKLWRYTGTYEPPRRKPRNEVLQPTIGGLSRIEAERAMQDWHDGERGATITFLLGRGANLAQVRFGRAGV